METTLPIQTCAYCGATGSSRFCGECGRPRADDAAVPAGARDLVRETAVEVLGLDRRLVASARDLLAHPVRVIRAHLDGRPHAYVNPLKLFLFLGGLYMLGTSWVQPFGSQNDLVALLFTGRDESPEAVITRHGIALEVFWPRYIDRINAATPLTLALVLVPMALFLRLMHRGRTVRDHLVFLLVISNSIWIISLLVLPLAFASPVLHWWAAMIGTFGYLGIGYFAVYRHGSRLRTLGGFTVFALVDMIVSTIMGVLLVLLVFTSLLYF